ncbi:unnamed protein product [Blepharisma stoltei]|uniref:Uncharacterized protein n=1 Tax=Blepharisma stoltei TaxID=1481888 RepID=A0AAU9KGE8_9CILI|nr:unnamed protein product [Blepharisma stoltei]
MSNHVPEISTASTIGSPSLLEAKKQRKQLQQDAALLSNRIKLLQLEEERTWKKIEEAKNRKNQIEHSKMRNENKQKEIEKLYQTKEQMRLEAQEKIKKLKFERNSGKNRNVESIQNTKKDCYKYGREWKVYSLQQRILTNQAYREKNKQRAMSVKLEERHRQMKLKKMGNRREEENKEDYLQRVKQEEEAKKQLERQVMEMELIEMELIRKLQQTQMIQQEAISDLEKAVSYKPGSVQD